MINFPALKTQLGYGKSVTLGDVGVEFALFLSYYIYIYIYIYIK
jgi:hypothetical protein